jgi:peptide-methionine (S)-S-oxide reductase
MTRESSTARKIAAKPAFWLSAAVAALGAWALTTPSAAQEGIKIPAPVLDAPAQGNSAVAVLAGGCFWGVQGVFQHVEGVTNAVSGYAGGDKQTAQYNVVGSGSTGHAESVRITFDPHKISYGQILRVYFSVAHDPTELNRQGPDTGTQYRSTIFPADAEQAKVAKAYVAQLDKAKVFDAAIATTIEPGRAFYKAEDYHQDFLTLNPTYPYIVYNDLPKIENLKRLFPDRYRSDPVLVSEAKTSN